MHQPYYKDPFTGIYRLPWVRLHATKDYLDMIEILTDFPDIKQTFNLTPSLLEQIIDYTENNATDYFLELTRKKASELDVHEKEFILEKFFLANWDNMIKIFPRYNELLSKRGIHFVKSDYKRILKNFNDVDFLDLQVLFNLCWIDPMFRDRDPFLSMLVQKGRNYSEEEKDILISKQFYIMKQIIPRYREMARKDQIELSVSPYYHPILPLLCDTDIARVSTPDARLPQKKFRFPEDAEAQVKMSIEFFEKTFGYTPNGMWPSEGSVSEDVVKIISKLGIKWIATDEDVLSLSLDKKIRDPSGNIIEPSLLYKPYNFENLSIVFRDHILSDLIGFVYSTWDAKKAAEDFINRLLKIREDLPKDKPYLVSIILDGENAWEYYKNDGHDFLRHLYDGISKEKRLKTITISQFIMQFDKGEPLKKLHPGSWINANFNIWIGHEEDNTAWDYLTEAREKIEFLKKTYPEKDLTQAFKSIYIAEGSDWNWWYGDEHITENQEEFDELFRSNLMKVYKDTEIDIPSHLLMPVLKEERSVSPSVNIRGFIYPKIDGLVTSYYEWYQGAHIDVKKLGGSMHKAESILSTLYYGFNKDKLFLRLDPLISFDKLEESIRFYINILGPLMNRIAITLKPLVKAELFAKNKSEWKKIKDINDVAVQDIFEIAIPFDDLNVKEKDELYLNISILKNSEEIEKCPCRGYVSITVPTADFEAMMWY